MNLTDRTTLQGEITEERGDPAAYTSARFSQFTRFQIALAHRQDNLGDFAVGIVHVLRAVPTSWINQAKRFRLATLKSPMPKTKSSKPQKQGIGARSVHVESDHAPFVICFPHFASRQVLPPDVKILRTSNWYWRAFHQQAE